MTTYKKQKTKKVKRMASTHHLIEIELIAIEFVCISFVASIAIIQETKDPIVWAFLGTAIGIILRQINKKNKN